MNMIQKFFAFSIESVTTLFLVIGMELAATKINDENAIEFEVAILFVFRMIQAIQMLIR